MGIDGMGIDGMGIDGMGIDGMGIDRRGIDRAGALGRGFSVPATTTYSLSLLISAPLNSVGHGP